MKDRANYALVGSDYYLGYDVYEDLRHMNN